MKGEAGWVVTTSLLAFVLWSLMFHFGIGDFWWMMTASASALAAISLVINRQRLAELFRWRTAWLAWGIGSAALLYVVFWVGDFLARHMFDFAADQVGAIYGLRAGDDPMRIGLLLFFIIGPAEEIFWRGFLQASLQRRFAVPLLGWLAAGLIYALVHVWSLNFMLVMAAAICGLYWGLIFYVTRSLWPGIISHAVWDVIVFLILPIS